MIITSKFQSWCARCGKTRIEVGDRCEWAPPARGVICLACLGTSPPAKLPAQSFTKDAKKRQRDDDDRPRDVQAVPSVPVLPPAIAAMDGLEAQFIRMAAKTSTPAIDKAWGQYEKVRNLAMGNTNAQEQRVALCTALVILVKALFLEEKAYVI